MGQQSLVVKKSRQKQGQWKFAGSLGITKVGRHCRLSRKTLESVKGGAPCTLSLVLSMCCLLFSIVSRFQWSHFIPPKRRVIALVMCHEYVTCLEASVALPNPWCTLC